MAWTAPYTFVDSTLTVPRYLSAALLNTQIRDNLLADDVGVATTNGDIFYATNLNTLTRLPIGTSLTHLNITNGLPSWGANEIVTLRTTDNIYVYDSTQYKSDSVWAFNVLPNEIWAITLCVCCLGVGLSSAIHLRAKMPSNWLYNYSSELSFANGVSPIVSGGYDDFLGEVDAANGVSTFNGMLARIKILFANGPNAGSWNVEYKQRFAGGATYLLVGSYMIRRRISP